MLEPTKHFGIHVGGPAKFNLDRHRLVNPRDPKGSTCFSTFKPEAEIDTDLSFTSATITVEQPPGTLVLTVTCTFDPPTSDGPVSKADVSCTSS